MKKLIIVTGPTASGKTELAIRLAKEYGTGVISADSRQIYADIPIATAQPTEEEMQGVRHHLIGHLPLDSYYSASSFEQDALSLIKEQFQTSDRAIVCGGSMLYIDTLCYGIDDLPTIPEEFRSGLKDELDVNGVDWLKGRLRILDPEYYFKADLKNAKRLFHAYEISLYTGKPYSSFLTGRRKVRNFEIERKVIELPREILFARINERTERMVKSGLEEEARSVYSMKGLNSLNTVGLKEMFDWFEGKLDRATAIERIKKNTRVYAKKQITWMRRSKTS